MVSSLSDCDCLIIRYLYKHYHTVNYENYAGIILPFSSIICWVWFVLSFLEIHRTVHQKNGLSWIQDIHIVPLKLF